MKSQRGFTIVEIMVAITVGLVLLLGITHLLLAGKKSFRLQNASAVLQENGRYAMNFLTTNLRSADHWGGVEARDVIGTPAVSGSGTNCNAAWILNVDNGIEGHQGAATLPAALTGCIHAANYQPNTDVVIVRYGDADDPIATGSLSGEGSKVFVRSAVGERAELITGAGGPSSLPAATEQPGTYNFPYVVNMFFVRPCSVLNGGTCSGSDSIPTLVRLSLTSGGNLQQSPLVEGVEHMKIEYGLDTTNDGRPNQFRTANNIAASGWPNVVSVRLSLVVRSLDRDPDLIDTTTYVMLPGPNGSNYTAPLAFNDFPRKVFGGVVQIRNRTRG